MLSRLLAVFIAAVFSYRILTRGADFLAAAACGLILAITTTHLIPEAFEAGINPHTGGLVLLVSLTAFVVMERVLLTTPTHFHPQRIRKVPALLGGGTQVSCCGGSGNPGARLVFIGSALHNAADGALIAAAFLSDWRAGLLVTLAIFAHEVPQLIGVMLLLKQTGMGQRSATLLCLGAASFAVLGGLAGGWLFIGWQFLTPYVLLVAAASFLYLVLREQLPDLAWGKNLGRTVTMLLFMAAGMVVSIGILAPVHELAETAAGVSALHP